MLFLFSSTFATHCHLSMGKTFTNLDIQNTNVYLGWAPWSALMMITCFHVCFELAKNAISLSLTHFRICFRNNEFVSCALLCPPWRVTTHRSRCITCGPMVESTSCERIIISIKELGSSRCALRAVDRLRARIEINPSIRARVFLTAVLSSFSNDCEWHISYRSIFVCRSESRQSANVLLPGTLKLLLIARYFRENEYATTVPQDATLVCVRCLRRRTHKVWNRVLIFAKIAGSYKCVQPPCS